MKKFFILLFVFLFISPPVSLAIPDAFNEPLTDFALLNIPHIPDDAVFVMPGQYHGGTDIPVGFYRIDTDSYGCHISFDLPEMKYVYTGYFGKNFGLTTISCIPIVDGSMIRIEGNGVYFTETDFSPLNTDTFDLYPGVYRTGIDIPEGVYIFSQKDKYPASVYVHIHGKFYSESSFHGDIGSDSKVELSESSFLTVYDFPVSVKKYKSPFFIK